MQNFPHFHPTLAGLILDLAEFCLIDPIVRQLGLLTAIARPARVVVMNISNHDSDW